MPAARRVVLILVVALVVAAVGVLALRAGGVPIGLGPDVSPTPTPSASSQPTPTSAQSASAAPSIPGDEEVLAILAEIEDQVEEIRGLPPADIGPPDIITRDELADELQRLFDEEYPPEDRERDSIALRALGLLEPDQDVAELQLELLGDQVLGFYDKNDKRMVVVTDAGLDIEARITYAHEYTHALQDAAFGLDTLETDAPGEDDRGLARTALFEGDATVTMFAWAIEHLSPAELQDYFLNLEAPDTGGTPSWMVDQLAFPYFDGVTWVQAQVGPDPLRPDYTDIDAAFEDPPDSTEQIIDVDKWFAREEPVPVVVPDLAAALGTGWEEVDATPIGEAFIEIMLSYFGVVAADAEAAAEGWGGDRAVIVTGPDDAFAVAWRVAWDSAADAAEFADAYTAVVNGLDFPASVTALPSGEILVAHASTPDLLAQTVAAAD
jgi:hypothetical protein